MKAEQILDHAILQLSQQGCKSQVVGVTYCAYNGAHGRHCAIGHLAIDAPFSEGDGVNNLKNLNILHERGVLSSEQIRSREFRAWLSGVQTRLHDTVPIPFLSRAILQQQVSTYDLRYQAQQLDKLLGEL